MGEVIKLSEKKATPLFIGATETVPVEADISPKRPDLFAIMTGPCPHAEPHGDVIHVPPIEETADEETADVAADSETAEAQTAESRRYGFTEEEYLILGIG